MEQSDTPLIRLTDKEHLRSSSSDCPSPPATSRTCKRRISAGQQCNRRSCGRKSRRGAQPEDQQQHWCRGRVGTEGASMPTNAKRPDQRSDRYLGTTPTLRAVEQVRTDHGYWGLSMIKYAVLHTYPVDFGIMQQQQSPSRHGSNAARRNRGGSCIRSHATIAPADHSRSKA